MIIKNCDHKIVILITWIGRKNKKCSTHKTVKKREMLLLFLLLLLQCSRIINKRNEFIHRNILFFHSTNSSLYRHFNKFMVIFSPPLSRTWTLSSSFFFHLSPSPQSPSSFFLFFLFFFSCSSLLTLINYFYFLLTLRALLFGKWRICFYKSKNRLTWFSKFQHSHFFLFLNFPSLFILFFEFPSYFFSSIA